MPLTWKKPACSRQEIRGGYDWSSTAKRTRGEFLLSSTGRNAEAGSCRARSRGVIAGIALRRLLAWRIVRNGSLAADSRKPVGLKKLRHA